MTREDKKEEKIRYKAFAFRLNDKTYKKLVELRTKEQLSWNKLIYKLIKSYESKTRIIQEQTPTLSHTVQEAHSYKAEGFSESMESRT